MFNNDLGKRYGKALVFGTGGGNDIVSAVLAAMYLNRQGIETDVGGILSPAAVHTFSGQPEQVINEIGADLKRHIPSKTPVEISLIDAKLPQLTRSLGMPIDNFYGLSIRSGTSALVDGLEELVAANSYDLVVAVDVGGDILARGREDPTLLSPVMDFTSLYAVGQLSVDTLLVEFGLGTDGELRPEGIWEILKELKDRDLLLHEGMIGPDDCEVSSFRRLFDQVAGIRRGHTAVMTLQTLDTETPSEDIISDYHSGFRIGDSRWKNVFPITLPHQTFGRTYVIDAKGFAQSRNQTAFSYENPLEQYIRLKRIPEWKTELDLHHLWSGDGWRTESMEGYCLCSLVIPTGLENDMRKDIIEHGIRYMKERKRDAVLLLKEDADGAGTGSLYRVDAGRFSLVSASDDQGSKNFLEETGKLIGQYQK